MIAIMCLVPLVLLLLAASATAEPKNWPADVPGFVPVAPNEHPRLLFRRSDLPSLRARMQTADGQAMIARLKLLLGGGETMPTHYQPSTTAYNPDSPGEMPVGTYTIMHAAGFGLLWQLTGEPKYADLGRQCFEKAFEGVRDRDDRYSFRSPGGMLRAGPSIGWYAIGYDLLADGWDADFRRKVAAAIQDYGQPDTGLDNEGHITLERLCLRPRHKPGSNHWGMQVGGAALAVLAIRGDDGTDSERLEKYLRNVEKNFRRSLLEGHGEYGYYTEGHHCGRMTAMMMVPAIQAWRNADGKNYVTVSTRVQHLAIKWLYEMVRHDGRVHTVMRDRYARDFDHGGINGGEFSQGFGIMLDKHTPAALWFYHNVVAPGDQHVYDAHVYPGRAVLAYINWPIGVQPANPETVLPKALADVETGYFVFRNRWRDENDIFITAHLGTKPGAYGTGHGGPIMGFGLGLPIRFGGGFRNYKPVYYLLAEDGSGVVSATPRGGGQVSSFAVDFSKASGAECLIVMTGDGSGSSRATGSDGAVLSGETVTAGRRRYFVTALHRGQPPVPRVEGETIIVGDQIISFDGQKIVLSTMKAARSTGP